MTGKKIIGMGIALAVLVGLALMQKQGRKKTNMLKVDPGAMLLQDINLNSVDAVEITEASNTVSLVKQNGKWVVASLYDYPAEFSRLADALRAASEVKLGIRTRGSKVDSAGQRRCFESRSPGGRPSGRFERLGEPAFYSER